MRSEWASTLLNLSSTKRILEAINESARRNINLNLLERHKSHILRWANFISCFRSRRREMNRQEQKLRQHRPGWFIALFSWIFREGASVSTQPHSHSHSEAAELLILFNDYYRKGKENTWKSTRTLFTDCDEAFSTMKGWKSSTTKEDCDVGGRYENFLGFVPFYSSSFFAAK